MSSTGVASIPAPPPEPSYPRARAGVHRRLLRLRAALRPGRLLDAVLLPARREPPGDQPRPADRVDAPAAAGARRRVGAHPLVRLRPHGGRCGRLLLHRAHRKDHRAADRLTDHRHIRVDRSASSRCSSCWKARDGCRGRSCRGSSSPSCSMRCSPIGFRACSTAGPTRSRASSARSTCHSTASSDR